MIKSQQQHNRPQPGCWCWLLLFGLRAWVRLPYPFLGFCGRSLGTLLFLLRGTRYQVAKTNLNLCFPKLTQQQIRQLLRAHFRSLGFGLMETLICWGGSTQRLQAIPVEIEGESHLRQALAAQRGVILFSGHFTSLAMGATLLSLHYPLATVYRPLTKESPCLEWLIRHLKRPQEQIQMIGRKQLHLFRQLLAANQIIWYAADQNYAGQHQVFAPFFNIPTATNIAIRRIVQFSGAQVLPFYQQRLDEGYRLVIQPPIANFPTEDKEADGETLNSVIADMIIQQPSDYLWIHRRFRHRPPSMPAFYQRRKKS